LNHPSRSIYRRQRTTRWCNIWHKNSFI